MSLLPPLVPLAWPRREHPFSPFRLLLLPGSGVRDPTHWFRIYLHAWFWPVTYISTDVGLAE